jgi:ketosteroid isomerase-like protein
MGLGVPLGAGPSEEEKIESVVAAVIEAYRSADFATMGRYFASEATFVPSDYNPPIAGWNDAQQRYQRAMANVNQMELTRENTQIKRRGKTAWVVYQWRFAGLLANQPFGGRGHTTLVLEKRGRDWVIVHNHTSALPTPPAVERTPTTEKPPS